MGGYKKIRLSNEMGLIDTAPLKQAQYISDIIRIILQRFTDKCRKYRLCDAFVVIILSDDPRQK